MIAVINATHSSYRSRAHTCHCGIQTLSMISLYLEFPVFTSFKEYVSQRCGIEVFYPILCFAELWYIAIWLYICTGILTALAAVIKTHPWWNGNVTGLSTGFISINYHNGNRISLKKRALKKTQVVGISMLKSISFNNFLMWLLIGWQQAAVSQTEVMIESTC